MFKFLKDKLKSVVDKFSKEVEEEAEEIKSVESKSESSKQTNVYESKQEKKKEESNLEKKVQDVKNKIIKEEKKSKPKETQEKKEIPEKTPELIKENISKEKPIEKDIKQQLEEPIVAKKDEEQPKPVETINVVYKKESQSQEIIKESKEETLAIPESKIIEIEQLENIQEEQEFKEKKGFFGKLFGKTREEIVKEPEIKQTKIVKESKGIVKEQEATKEELVKDIKEVPKEKTTTPFKQDTKKKGFFGKVSETFTKIHLSDEKFEEFFWDIYVALLENNVAVEVIEKIKLDLKEELTTDKISRKNTQEIIIDSLKRSLNEVLSVPTIDLEAEIKKKKPYIIAVIGVNGSGKTTAIAKIANMFKEKGYSIVLAAADTFRAAAIQQLEEHANKLGIKLIKHDYNSDPAAVAFDAVKHAQAKGIDIVLVDTAGRLHSNDNLMNELKKLIKVNNPDFKLFVGESITGNDCVEQATKYNELIGIDGIFLTKADIDEKGGAPISISYVTKKPVLFIGTGQTYADIKPFNKQDILDNIGL